MKTIRISDQVWDKIAENGKFGESPDDVLLRLFELDQSPNMGHGVQTEIAEREEFTATPPYDAPRSFFMHAESPDTEQRFQHIKKPRQILSSRRMTSRVENGFLRVQFQDSPYEKWPLPSKEDKYGIRVIRSKATEFAEKNGATIGQLNAVRKALTSAGYHLTK